MTDDELRQRLVKGPDGPIEETIQNPLDSPIESVMNSYQCANKWLDSIKEELLMTHNTLYFSNYVHELAHKMPGRFDKFGDIIHSLGMKVPYPATPSIPFLVEGSSILEMIDMILQIIGMISSSLTSFIDSVGGSYRSAAIKAEELLTDIDSEKLHFYRIMRALQTYSNPLEFDKWVCWYVHNSNNLLD